MKTLNDEDILALDMNTLGAALTNGNEILTGSTMRDDQALGIDPRTISGAACDYLQWLSANTDYYCEIGTGFWKHSSYLYFRFYKKSDDSLLREWKSGAIKGRANTSKIAIVHELLGLSLLSNLCKYIAEV